MKNLGIVLAILVLSTQGNASWQVFRDKEDGFASPKPKSKPKIQAIKFDLTNKENSDLISRLNNHFKEKSEEPKRALCSGF